MMDEDEITIQEIEQELKMRELTHYLYKWSLPNNKLEKISWNVHLRTYNEVNKYTPLRVCIPPKKKETTIEDWI